MKKPEPMIIKTIALHEHPVIVSFFEYRKGLPEAVNVEGGIYSDNRLDRLIASLIKHRDYLKEFKKGKK